MTIPAVLFVDNVSPALISSYGVFDSHIQFGRRPMLAWGEANMAVSHAVIGAVVAVYGGRFDQGYKAAGNGAVFMGENLSKTDTACQLC